MEEQLSNARQTLMSPPSIPLPNLWHAADSEIPTLLELRQYFPSRNQIIGLLILMHLKLRQERIFLLFGSGNESDQSTFWNFPLRERLLRIYIGRLSVAIWCLVGWGCLRSKSIAFLNMSHASCFVKLIITISVLESILSTQNWVMLF